MYQTISARECLSTHITNVKSQHQQELVYHPGTNVRGYQRQPVNQQQQLLYHYGANARDHSEQQEDS